jgi:hypothetical protein
MEGPKNTLVALKDGAQSEEIFGGVLSGLFQKGKMFPLI